MTSRRLLLLVVLAIIAAALAYVFVPHQRRAAADNVVVYYTKADGTTLGSFHVTLGTARDQRSVAFYAATQALAGPPADVSAVRFPNGTHVLDLRVEGSTADVDLSSEVKSSAEGGLAEAAEFKGLVWTLTALPGIKTVKIRVGGARLTTLPGGHFELDEPLSRSSW